jgi:WD40 repeat protein
MDEYFRKKIPYEITALAINSNSFAAAGENKVCFFSKVKHSFDYSWTYEDGITQVVTALEFVPQTKSLIVGFGSGVLKIIETNLVKHVWDKDKGHEGHKISSISAHSSGKIALTFSASSGILKTWNLEKK